MSNLLSLFPDIYTVSDDGCWLYQGKLPSSGRPTVIIGNRGIKLARLICYDTHGLPPDPKMHAAHKCHNKLCINPYHIEWKQPVDNTGRAFHENGCVRKREDSVNLPVGVSGPDKDGYYKIKRMVGRKTVSKGYTRDLNEAIKRASELNEEVKNCRMESK